MRRNRMLTLGLAIGLALAMLPAAAMAKPEMAGPPEEVRFATFNASLNRNNAGDLAAELVGAGQCATGCDRRDHPADPAGRVADQ